MNYKKTLFIASFLLLFFRLQAQLIPLHSDYTNRINTVLTDTDRVTYTSMKPLLVQPSELSRDTFLNVLYSPHYRDLKQRLLNGHLLQVHQKDVNLALDPVLSLITGKSGDRSGLTYVNTRGINVQGSVGKVYFGSMFLENQARFPQYLDSAIRINKNVVPGQGIGRSYGKGGFDFARSDAYIGYTPSSAFNIILGYGKNFIGDGYRSLLLSDNAFSYPYLRLNAKFWRINYTVLYNQFTNPNYVIHDTYQRKYSTIHYLSVDVSKRFQVGVFESIIWQASDSTFNRGFDVQYLNPVLFLRPVEYSEGSADNAMLGLNLKYQLPRNGFLYGQLMLDDFNLQETIKHRKQHLNNKYALQLGYWKKDVFSKPGLNYRLEYNTVRPFTYGHRKVNQNYTHYNQALAHPLGANFHEVINNFHYNKNRWYGELHSVFALIGEDYGDQLYGNNLWGGEVGVPLLGSKTLDGLRTTFGFNQLTVGWIANPKWNMRVQLQAGNRFRKNTIESKSETFFNVGIVTNLANYYYDF